MRPCPSCGGDCGYTKKKGCQYQSGESEWVGLTEDEIKECFAITPDQFLPKKGCQYQSGESEWIGLTDEEIQECLQGLPTQTIDVYARRIEAKLKEKNGY